MVRSTLDHHIADDFEAQDLDFKQWNDRCREDNVKKMIKYAVCMANGGGGSVVFGVADKIKGIDNVLKGVPFDVDIHELQQRILKIQIPLLRLHLMKYFIKSFYKAISNERFPEIPPYTTIDGTATIRIGKECLAYKVIEKDI